MYENSNPKIFVKFSILYQENIILQEVAHFSKVPKNFLRIFNISLTVHLNLSIHIYLSLRTTFNIYSNQNNFSESRSSKRKGRILVDKDNSCPDWYQRREE